MAVYYITDVKLTAFALKGPHRSRAAGEYGQLQLDGIGVVLGGLCRFRHCWADQRLLWPTLYHFVWPGTPRAWAYTRSYSPKRKPVYCCNGDPRLRNW
jgi:hypothetical protein